MTQACDPWSQTQSRPFLDGAAVLGITSPTATTLAAAMPAVWVRVTIMVATPMDSARCARRRGVQHNGGRAVVAVHRFDVLPGDAFGKTGAQGLGSRLPWRRSARRNEGRDQPCCRSTAISPSVKTRCLKRSPLFAPARRGCGRLPHRSNSQAKHAHDSRVQPGYSRPSPPASPAPRRAGQW